jgi:hypothetical protein
MKTWRCIYALILTAFIGLFLFPAVSAAKGIEKRVSFEKGRSSQLVEGSVVRGDRDTYIIGARAKQTLTVFIGSLEDNAVFTIMDNSSGKPLKGAEEGADAKRWSGVLPSSGDYRIIVGGTRGNTSYIMKIEIQ